MSKNTKKLVPKLRFPEFRDAGEWEQLRLQELAKRVSAKNKNGQIVRVLTNSAADGIVDQRDYFDKDIAVQGNLEGYYIVDNGDYVYNPRVSNLAPVGPISKNKLGTGVMSPLYSVFRFKSSDDSFYEQYFKTPNWHQYLRTISNSGARHDRMAISTDDFMSMPLPVPTPRERQKIADCLSSIDELISAQSQKVEALKTHKKSLMQQLFPREGETVPRLRFPEFRDVGEWKADAFHEIYDFKVTNSFSRDMLNYENGIVKNIHYGDIHTKFSILFNINDELVPFINPSVSLEKIRQECYCVEGDMIFADASEDLADVGKSIELVNLNNERLVSGLHTILARQRQNKMVLGFGGYLFQSQRIRKQIQKESQGAKVLGLSSGRLARIEVAYPSDKKEQQKIADCLSTIDVLITAQNQKLEALKTHKKGLMQQLFPSVGADSE